MTTQLGLQLRDQALAQSRAGREERIEKVRRELLRRLERMDYEQCASVPTLYGHITITADDVQEVLEDLGLNEGDTRWSGNVLRGWGVVTATNEYVPSRRSVNHCRPVRVWRYV